MGYFDIAQICLNGHLINSRMKEAQQHNKNYCDICGKATINKCQKCDKEIHGYHHGGGNEFSYSLDKVPSCCYNCGKPYPWTEAKIKATEEYIDLLENLSVEEKNSLKKGIDDILAETPRTKLAIATIKKHAIKLGQTGKDIFVDLASEAIKKLLLGL
ncbi:MAG: hypothetical protein A2297_07305 [Elusimicrobia bacterium RIFOXYB2_FULL_48_7]|nr:MAG: hypothetical protein A2297_07305 [Elusimicrobia bacterium RIFOXYB2_FULL_48_7]